MKILLGIILLGTFLDFALKEYFLDYPKDDVSHFEGYAEITEREYETLKKLFVYGVTKDLGRPKKLDYYAIERLKIGGPEIPSKEILPAGTRVRIKKAFH